MPGGIFNALRPGEGGYPMKQLAKRSQTIQPSPTLAVTALANTLRAQGKDIVGFGAGEPDFDTPQNIKNAAKAAIDAGDTKYPPVPGTKALKEAVLQKLKNENHLSYALENIIVCSGGKHALFNAMSVLINDGDEVIVPAPYWVSYPEQIRFLGGKEVIIETDDTAHFKMTPEQLQKAITKKTKVLILNSPSNPTGVAYTKDELQTFAELCVKHDLYILSDEIYEHIVYDGFKHISVATLSEEIKAHTITVNGASKCYAMTGWRMGFAAGPKEIIQAMSNAQGQSTSGVCSITQAACVEAYRGPQDGIKTMVAAFKERRDFIVKALNDIKGITCFKPQGAFYVFPNISSIFGKKTLRGKTISNSQEFCVHLLEEHLVACVPGSAFGADRHIRLSYATDLKTIRKGIERIAKAVRELS